MANRHLEKSNIIPEKCLSIIDDAINKYSINSFNYKYTKNVLELEEIDNQSDATLFFNDNSDEESELKTYSSILIDGENTTWNFTNDSKFASNMNPVMNKRIINDTNINKNILEILKHVQKLNKSNQINHFIRKMEYNEIKEMIFINTKMVTNSVKKIYNILNNFVKNKTMHLNNNTEYNSLYGNYIKNKSQNYYKKNKTIFKKYIILQKYYKKICQKYKEENEYLKNQILAKKNHDQNGWKNGAKGDKKKDKNVISGINHNIINETIKDHNLIDINYKKNNRKNLYPKKNKLINWKRVKEYTECSETEHFIKKDEKNICTNNYLTISKNEDTEDCNVVKNIIPLSTGSLVGLNLNQSEKEAPIVSEQGTIPSQGRAENEENEDVENAADAENEENEDVENEEYVGDAVDAEDADDVENEEDAADAEYVEDAVDAELYMAENDEVNNGMIEVTDLKFESDNVDKREPIVDDENGKQ
ncbi:hypothetical protein YYC_04905 [Plasmodium yoelii 17X]|uniref:Uncharacterized protein n=1 Tax=Plasmodium yoelii 17X TaxID=1323249 RepID=V7PBX3_PLAYE|nr:hypothetical protein YYC_04905 [Plasmodium yoelii 17X]